MSLGGARPPGMPPTWDLTEHIGARVMGGTFVLIEFGLYRLLSNGVVELASGGMLHQRDYHQATRVLAAEIMAGRITVEHKP
jgi:hypothetical protein